MSEIEEIEYEEKIQQINKEMEILEDLNKESLKELSLNNEKENL